MGGAAHKPTPALSIPSCLGPAVPTCFATSPALAPGPALHLEVQTRALAPSLPGVQVPLIASNRIGTETFENSHITFYGGSFVAAPSGEIVAQAS